MSIHGIDKDCRNVRIVNGEDKSSTSGPYYRDEERWHIRGKGEVGEGVEGLQGTDGQKGTDGPETPAGTEGREGTAGKDAEPQFTQAQVDALLALIEPEE